MVPLEFLIAMGCSATRLFVTGKSTVTKWLVAPVSAMTGGREGGPSEGWTEVELFTNGVVGFATDKESPIDVEGSPRPYS